MMHGARSEEKYIWTQHARMKLRHYRLTEARIKRIIRHPARVEEGIFDTAIACMQPSSDLAAAKSAAGLPAKNHSEIWAFYVLTDDKSAQGKKIKVISAWRYPGTSPARDPIPPDVLREIRRIQAS